CHRASSARHRGRDGPLIVARRAHQGSSFRAGYKSDACFKLQIPSSKIQRNLKRETSTLDARRNSVSRLQRPTLNVQHHNQETLTLILSRRERREVIVTSIQHPASSIQHPASSI